MQRYGALAMVVAGFLMGHAAIGQVDPDRRELLEMGFSQATQGGTPIDAYGYYYLNEPNFFATNITLRLAFAGVYLDSETGFVHLLGPNTDLGLGLAGGGFADDYYEFHQGTYVPTESFFGDNAQGSVSVYHLFNPASRIPLFGIVRVSEHYSIYARDDTSPNFVLPRDHSTFAWRTGMRWGGRPPMLYPDLAMELSAWYEGELRSDAGPYGFNGDRALNSSSQRFWARGLLTYTLANSNRIDFSVTAGTSANADRFSAYRLGGMLPLASEFPLMIPGYVSGELSARNFACVNAQYCLTLDAAKQWSLNPIGSVATVSYLPGLSQPGTFNSGAGIGLGYRSRSGVWQAIATYSYGFEAIRSSGRGGQAVGILLQYDLRAHNPHGSSQFNNITDFLRDRF